MIDGEKLLLVDDHVVIRTGLKVLLSDLYPFIEIHEATDGESMLQKLREHQFRLIIMDVQMPNTESISTLTTVIAKYPGASVLIYSMCAETIYAKRFIKAGAKGFLSKEAPLSELKKAIHQVLNNKRYISEAVVEMLTEDIHQDKPSNPFSILSPREFEIVSMLLSGHTLSDISHTLNIQPSTVATHKARVFEKLKVKNILELKDLATVYEFT
jgi:two-component system, NarL family, invasion response regulator UvrY